MQSVLINLDKHPAERDLIGKIILAYGVLEVALMEIVRAVMNDDINTAVRALYRLKSESNRLEVADALIRPRAAEQGLSAPWHDAYCAMKFCKGVRNTHAHSQWISDEHGVLRYGDLEKAAKTHGEKCQINMIPITRPVLEKQIAYFSYAQHLLLWVLDQYQTATKQPRKLSDEQYVTKPKRIPLPKLDSRTKARSHR